MTCAWHLCDNLITGQRQKFCSDSCKVKFYVTENRRKTKLRAVQYKGGKCQRCGYNRCLGALHFHHQGDKEFGIARSGITRAWEKVKKELDKCELVCANCHAEVHQCQVAQ